METPRPGADESAADNAAETSAAAAASAALAAVIRARRTDKVLGDPAAPAPAVGPSRAELDALLETAAAAPMHYPTHRDHRQLESGMVSVAPYRAYKLDAAGCRALLAGLRRDGVETAKIAEMLAVAAALIQVTWTPEPPLGPEADAAAADEAWLRNMEHVAASSAFIQNVLLLATAGGWRSYWSSGGVLRREEGFARLEIPAAQIVIGSVFLFPRKTGEARIVPGKWRDQRGGVADWSVWRDPVV